MGATPILPSVQPPGRSAPHGILSWRAVSTGRRVRGFSLVLAPTLLLMAGTASWAGEADNLISEEGLYHGPWQLPGPMLEMSASLPWMVRELERLPAVCTDLSFPSRRTRRRARLALALLLDGRVDQARWRFGQIGFEVLRLNTGKHRLLVVREAPGGGFRGWDFIAVNPDHERPLVIEAPHPQHDRGTGALAAELMAQLGARALVLATTHRCAARRASTCHGRTGACKQRWNYGRYRRSDRAHITNTIFHAAHLELMQRDRSLVAVQVHGFARRPMRMRHVIISDGTRLPGRKGNHANGLARAIRAQLPRRRRGLVKSCNETSRQRYLCGTHNVQGRQVNGSRNPCRRAARRSRNRFVQLELSSDARKPGGIIPRGILARAMGAYWGKIINPDQEGR